MSSSCTRSATVRISSPEASVTRATEGTCAASAAREGVRCACATHGARDQRSWRGRYGGRAFSRSTTPATKPSQSERSSITYRALVDVPANERCSTRVWDAAPCREGRPWASAAPSAAACATHGAPDQQCTAWKVHGVGVHHVFSAGA